MSDVKARVALAVLTVLVLGLMVMLLIMGSRIKALDHKVDSLSRHLALSPQSPSGAALKRQVQEHRAHLLEVNRALHQEDRAKYGEVVARLYQQARVQGRGEMNPTERAKSEEALSKLLENYPEANATGMLIAERALQSAMRMKAADVEFYFSMLTKQPKFCKIVTDNGIDAYPSLMVYLIHEYIRQGDKEKAVQYIQRLERDYGDRLVADKGPGGGPEWRLGSEICQKLRRELNRSGMGPGPGLLAPPPPPQG